MISQPRNKLSTTTFKQSDIQAFIRFHDLLQSVISASLSISSDEEFDASIATLLKQIGDEIEADRFCLFQKMEPEVGKKELQFRHLYEWCSINAKPSITEPMFQQVALEQAGLGRWLAALVKGESIQTLASEAPEQEQFFFQVIEAKSALAIPIFLDNSFWGFVAIEDNLKERNWTETEVSILKSLVCTLGISISYHKTQTGLNAIEKRFGLLVNSVGGIVWRFDPSRQVFTYVNDEAERLLGYPTDAWIEDTAFWPDHMHPDDSEEAFAFCQIEVEKGRNHELEYRMVAKDGHYVWLRDVVRCVKNEAGEVVELIGIMYDITAQKLAEAELTRSQLSLRQAQAIARIGSFEWNIKDNSVHWSEGLYTILGFDVDAFVPNFDRYMEIVHPEDREMFLGKIQATLNEGEPYDFEHRVCLANGQTGMLHCAGKVLFDDQKQPEKLLGVASDITHQKKIETEIRQLNEALEQRVDERTKDLEDALRLVQLEMEVRKKAEGALRESEKRYRMISENMSDKITIVGPEKRVRYISHSVKEMLGYNPHEIEGKDAFMMIWPEDQEYVHKGLTRLVEGESSVTISYRLKKKNGDPLWVESLARWLYMDDGSTDGILLTSRDISERKAAEEEMQKHLQKEKELNELKAKFISTASHQFRTPLASILSNVDLLEMLMNQTGRQGEKPIERISERIRGDIDRLVHLMDDILVLGRSDAAKTPFYPEQVDFSLLCEKVIQEVMATQQWKRKVELEVKGTPRPVVVDPKLIHNALSNILENAYKYSKDNHAPEMTLCFLSDRVKCIIKDYGVGILPADLPQLFQSFHRGQNVLDIEGNGLGLAIAKDFVDLHRGTIEVDSQPNVGTTFEIYLPT